jgi:cytochrome c oxidase subunit 2
VLAACAAACLLAGSSGSLAQAPGRRVIRVTAERFAFTPSQIEIEAGEQVDLHIRSDDTAHGFRIIGTTTNVTVPKRGKGDIVVSFSAERAGRYEFECSRMCGAGHNFMRGVIVIRERPSGEAAAR